MYPPWLANPASSLALKLPVGLAIAAASALLIDPHETFAFMKKCRNWKGVQA